MYTTNMCWYKNICELPNTSFFPRVKCVPFPQPDKGCGPADRMRTFPPRDFLGARHLPNSDGTAKLPRRTRINWTRHLIKSKIPSTDTQNTISNNTGGKNTILTFKIGNTNFHINFHFINRVHVFILYCWSPIILVNNWKCIWKRFFTAFLKHLHI